MVGVGGVVLLEAMRLRGVGRLVFSSTAAVYGVPDRVPIDEIDFKAKPQGPSWAHPLGTDDLGQDLLARMLYGGRISLAVGVAAMLIAITAGTQDHDDAAGLVLAEVELETPHQWVEMPAWLGQEITSDHRFGNSRLARVPVVVHAVAA